MWTEPYFKLLVILCFILLITINVFYQRDLTKSIKSVGEKCNTYTFSIPRADNGS